MRLLLLKELKYTPLILVVSSAFLGCKKNESSPQENKYELAHEFSGSNPCTYFNSNIDNSSELIEPLVSKENYEKYKKRLVSLKSLDKDDIHENDDEYLTNVFDTFEAFDFKPLLTKNGRQIDIFVCGGTIVNPYFLSREQIFEQILYSYFNLSNGD